VQIADSDNQINNDIIVVDQDDDDDKEEDDEVNVGVRLLPEEQLVNSLAAIGCATNEDYKNYIAYSFWQW
jgi:hypothetical protein